MHIRVYIYVPTYLRTYIRMYVAEYITVKPSHGMYCVDYTKEVLTMYIRTYSMYICMNIPNAQFAYVHTHAYQVHNVRTYVHTHVHTKCTMSAAMTPSLSCLPLQDDLWHRSLPQTSTGHLEHLECAT